MPIPVEHGQSRNWTKRTSPTLLARNTSLNLIAEGSLFVVLIVTMPRLVFLMGGSSFGLYSLGWAVLSYLSYLDLGVSRAATQFVSSCLAQDNLAGTRQVVRSAVLGNLILGLCCGVGMILTAPFLVHSAFHIPADIQEEGLLVFYVVALGVPVLMLQAVFRAIISSYQRFGLISLVHGGSTGLQYIVACVLAWKGFAVSTVLLSTVVIRIVSIIIYAAFLAHLLPGLAGESDSDLRELGKLLRFGGWVTVSQLIVQMLVSLDRILLASFVSLDAVTLYTVPYEGITRLRAVPGSLMATVFPAMTESGGGTVRGNLQILYDNCLRYLLVLMLPGICFLVVFGRDVLSIWMGSAFASRASVVLQALAAGFLLNSLAYVSYYAIQALGKPGIVGRYHLLVLPFYVMLSVLLIHRWGVVGAAVAATLRFGLDAVLLFWMAEKYCMCLLSSAWNHGISRILSLGVLLTVTLLMIRFVSATAWVRLPIGLLAVAFYFVVVWHLVLNAWEKPAILKALSFSRHQAAA